MINYWCLMFLLYSPFTFGNEDRRKLPKNIQHRAKLINSIGMSFVKIPKGQFQMGTMDQEELKAGNVFSPGTGTRGGTSGVGPAHRVTISKSFYLQTTEVTQGQWRKLMDSRPWTRSDSLIPEGENYPVVCLTWEEAQFFLNKLNSLEPGARYRLPTEAEWEYSCRAGTTTKYSFGDSEDQLDSYAWSHPYQGLKIVPYLHPVASRLPNPWGLFDMHGNVGEWCQDWASIYGSDSQTDPVGPSTGYKKILRGTYQQGFPQSCRSDWRDEWLAQLGVSDVGFRVLRESPATTRQLLKSRIKKKAN